MPNDPAQPSTRFLNGLRAIAAIWVMVAHCMLWGGFPYRVMNPQLAVDVFMMLSGYLMLATMQPRVPERGGSASRVWLAFYVRRFFRIAPLYYASLVLAVLSAPWFIHGYQELFDLRPATFGGPGSGFNPSLTDYSPGNIILHLTFLFGLFPDRVFSTMTGDWSLSLEMQFYLVFPVLLYAGRKFGPGKLSAAVIAASLLATYWFGHDFIEPAPLPLLLQYFLIGMLLFNATHMKLDGVLGIVGVIVALDYRLYGRQVVYLVPFALAIYLFASPRFRSQRLILLARRVLDNTFCDLGADLSYGIYLTHGFFISASALTLFHWPAFLGLSNLPRLMVMVAFVSTGTLAVSFVLHHLVERPGIGIGKRVAQAVTGRVGRPSRAASPVAGLAAESVSGND